MRRLPAASSLLVHTTIEVDESPDAVDITAGEFQAHLPICRCRDEPSTVYEPSGYGRGESPNSERLNLARCRTGGLHVRQVDELITRLVASFGGKRMAEVVRRSAA